MRICRESRNKEKQEINEFRAGGTSDAAALLPLFSTKSSAAAGDTAAEPKYSKNTASDKKGHNFRQNEYKQKMKKPDILGLFLWLPR
ncbi:MAG: hypothetical protein Q4A88_05890 [Clostridia bacterium]|nr:hypothetical protein [Clostridia bacterium]